MTKREQERLEALLQKKEAEEKADKEFFANVRKRKDEVLKVLGANGTEPEENYFETRLRDIAEKYGCSVYDLLNYIETDIQINYYKRNH